MRLVWLTSLASLIFSTSPWTAHMTPVSHCGFHGCVFLAKFRLFWWDLRSDGVRTHTAMPHRSTSHGTHTRGMRYLSRCPAHHPHPLRRLRREPCLISGLQPGREHERHHGSEVTPEEPRRWITLRTRAFMVVANGVLHWNPSFTCRINL